MRSSAAVVHYSKGYRKDDSNSLGPGINVQGSGAVGANIWNRELVGDRGDAQGPDGIPPSGSTMDHGYDVETRGRRRLVVSRVRGGDGRHGSPPHWSVHQEAEYNHFGEGGLLPHLCTVHGGRADAGDEPDGEMVGSKRGK